MWVLFCFLLHVVAICFVRDGTYKKQSCGRDIWRSTKSTDQQSADLHRCHEEIYSTSTRPEDGKWKIPFIFWHISQTVLWSQRDLRNGLTSNSTHKWLKNTDCFTSKTTQSKKSTKEKRINQTTNGDYRTFEIKHWFCLVLANANALTWYPTVIARKNTKFR